MSRESMNTTRTSDTHPLYVDFIDAKELPLPGRVELTFAPGKKQLSALTGRWDRDLDKDLTRLRDHWHTDVLVMTYAKTILT